jgi:hypothetical protein
MKILSSTGVESDSDIGLVSKYIAITPNSYWIKINNPSADYLFCDGLLV